MIFEELVRLLLVQKYQLFDRFVFMSKYILQFFLSFGSRFLKLFGLKWAVKNESMIFLSQNGQYEIL